jgi:hypothetical protein
MPVRRRLETLDRAAGDVDPIKRCLVDRPMRPLADTVADGERAISIFALSFGSSRISASARAGPRLLFIPV